MIIVDIEFLAGYFIKSSKNNTRRARHIYFTTTKVGEFGFTDCVKCELNEISGSVRSALLPGLHLDGVEHLRGMHHTRVQLRLVDGGRLGGGEVLLELRDQAAHLGVEHIHLP